jgi:hypothetical protein
VPNIVKYPTLQSTTTITLARLIPAILVISWVGYLRNDLLLKSTIFIEE